MAEQRDGELPTAVDVADDPVPRDTGLVEEDLVELRDAGHLHEWTHRDTRLVHRQGEHRDPTVFGDVEVGPGQQNPEVGVVGLRGPHLLTGDHPFIAVANVHGS